MHSLLFAAKSIEATTSIVPVDGGSDHALLQQASSSSFSSSTLVVPLVTVVQAALEPDGVLLQDFV